MDDDCLRKFIKYSTKLPNKKKSSLCIVCVKKKPTTVRLLKTVENCLVTLMRNLIKKLAYKVSAKKNHTTNT